MSTCPDCKGTGTRNGFGVNIPCENCAGTGLVEAPSRMGLLVTFECPWCREVIDNHPSNVRSHISKHMEEQKAKVIQPATERRIVEFDLVTDPFGSGVLLAAEINQKLERGWEIHGTMHTTPTGYAQAMVRREKESA